MSASHIAETGFLLALGSPSNERYQRVRTFAGRNDLTFIVPERVYEELSDAASSDQLAADSIPVDVAIDEGWVRVADPLAEVRQVAQQCTIQGFFPALSIIGEN